MENLIVEEFVKKRIEENNDLFTSFKKMNNIEKVYLLGLKDGIDLKTVL